ncbi:hypothetical protein [Stackebrandtia soli]|uniref:hypothetical protein n=1 Tax=Stackebrandtia soli TaxID=1892856 RepID=UPI0039E9A078
MDGQEQRTPRATHDRATWTREALRALTPADEIADALAEIEVIAAEIRAWDATLPAGDRHAAHVRRGRPVRRGCLVCRLHEAEPLLVAAKAGDWLACAAAAGRLVDITGPPTTRMREAIGRLRTVAIERASLAWQQRQEDARRPGMG